MAAAIEFDDVRVRYRGRRGVVTALDGLSLSVPEGGVYGFLGPNGAGKTTAIRAALGLLRGARGRIRVLGEPAPRRLAQVIDRVGAIVEQPSFFPNFTGRRNLELLAHSRGLADEGRTVFVSSHQLSEVEQTCDRVAIVARGRCVADGRVEDLLRGSSAKFRVKVSGDSAAHVLANAGWTVQDAGDHLVVEST